MTPELTTRTIVMEIRYFCRKMSSEMFRKSPCTSLSVTVIQREVTFQKDFDVHSRKIPLREPRHTTDPGIEMVENELQYVQACSQKS